MNDIKPDTFPKEKKVHSLVASLPDYLKDHANYEKIQRAILDAGATRHSHGEMVEWAQCKHCQQKQHDRLMMMRKLGFRSAAQYMTWNKIHNEITKRVPFAKYNS